MITIPSTASHSPFRPRFRPSSQQASRRAILAFCDVSNILAGGAQVAAARSGHAPTPQSAAAAGIADFSFRVDTTWLYQFVLGTDASVNARAFCFGSRKVDSVDQYAWEAWRRSGWEPSVFLRSCSGREKQVDTALALGMFEEVVLSGYSPADVEVTLVAGDGDYVPVLEKLAHRGFAIDVVCWEHVTAPSLRKLARRFIALDEYFELVRY
jgi:hypothetical protein